MAILAVIVQGCSLLLFSKLITRRLALSWWDGGYVGWVLFCAFQFTSMPSLLLVPGLVLLVGGAEPELDFKAALVISAESVLISIIVAHIAALLVRPVGLAEWALLATVGLSLLAGGVLYWIYNRQPVRVHREFNLGETVLAILTLSIVYTYILLIERYNDDLYFVFFDLLFFVFFGLTNLWIQYEHHKVQLRENSLAHERELLVSNERYTQAIEKHYNEMRRFRHDYQNVILSLDEYLQTADLDGLKAYYQTALKPAGARLTAEKYALEDLSRVQSKPIKSLLFNKLSAAQGRGIPVSFECRQPIEMVGIEPIAVVIMLGIILDNAIEAISPSKDGQLSVAIYSETGTVTLLVRNRLDPAQALPPLWQLKQAGFSTKGAQRGMGLSNLQRVVDTHPQVQLATTITDHHFLQRLTIVAGGADD